MKSKKKQEIYETIFSSTQVITNDEICEATGSNPTYVRRVINELRSEGYPICSTKEGYYYSEKIEDITATIRFLTNRVSTQLEAIDGLKMISLSRLIKQGENK